MLLRMLSACPPCNGSNDQFDSLVRFQDKIRTHPMKQCQVAVGLFVNECTNACHTAELPDMHAKSNSQNSRKAGSQSDFWVRSPAKRCSKAWKKRQQSEQTEFFCVPSKGFPVHITNGLKNQQQPPRDLSFEIASDLAPNPNGIVSLSYRSSLQLHFPMQIAIGLIP